MVPKIILFNIWKVLEIYLIQSTISYFIAKGVPALGVDPAFTIAADGTKEMINYTLKYLRIAYITELNVI